MRYACTEAAVRSQPQPRPGWCLGPPLVLTILRVSSVSESSAAKTSSRSAMAASSPPATRQRAAMSGEYAAPSPVMEPAVLPQVPPSSCYFYAECSCRSRHPFRFSSAFVHYYDEGGAANSLTRLGSPCRNRCLHSRLYLVRFTCDGIPCGRKGCPALATCQAGTINLGLFPQEDSSYIFKCVACGHESYRLHRGLTPQRVKWGRKPFPCPDPGGKSRSTSISSTSCAGGSHSCPQARSVVPPRRVCPTTTVQGLFSGIFPTW